MHVGHGRTNRFIRTYAHTYNFTLQIQFILRLEELLFAYHVAVTPADAATANRTSY